MTAAKNTGHQKYCWALSLLLLSVPHIPSYSTEVNFDTRVCVAQTVIIGKVPNNISDDLYFSRQSSTKIP